MTHLITRRQLAWIDENNKIVGLPTFVGELVEERLGTTRKCTMLAMCMFASCATTGPSSWPTLFFSALFVTFACVNPVLLSYRTVSINEVLKDMHRPDVSEQTLDKILNRFKESDKPGSYSRTETFIKDMFQIYASQPALTNEEQKVVRVFMKRVYHLPITKNEDLISLFKDPIEPTLGQSRSFRSGLTQASINSP